MSDTEEQEDKKIDAGEPTVVTHKADQQEAPIVEPPPEATKPEPLVEKHTASDPLGHLRDQAIALVPETDRAQMASLIRSIVDLYSNEQKIGKPADPEESPRVRARFSMLPTKPRITKGEPERPSQSYDFFKPNEG